MIELDGKEICIIDAHVHIWNEYKGMRYGAVSYTHLQQEAQSFEDTAYALGFDEVIVLSAENSVETQVSQINDLITSACDVIAKMCIRDRCTGGFFRRTMDRRQKGSF